jgi:hypothetical protein
MTGSVRKTEISLGISRNHAEIIWEFPATNFPSKSTPLLNREATKVRIDRIENLTGSKTLCQIFDSGIEYPVTRPLSREGVESIGRFHKKGRARKGSAL